MKYILRLKIDNKFVYMLADKFIARNKILSADSISGEPLEAKNLTFHLCEISNGKASTKHFGYIQDITPGKYLLWIKDENKKSDYTGQKVIYFNAKQVEIIDQVYCFF